MHGRHGRTRAWHQVGTCAVGVRARRGVARPGRRGGTGERRARRPRHELRRRRQGPEHVRPAVGRERGDRAARRVDRRRRAVRREQPRVVVRRRALAPDGTPDPAFSGDGQFNQQFAAGPGGAGGVALQSDGKIVAAGGVLDVQESDGEFGLLRLTTAGVPDAAFGTGGEVTTEFAGGDAEAEAVTVLADGTIVAVGELETQSGSEFAIARYDTGGTLLWQTTTPFAEGRARAADVVVEANRLVAVGTVNPPSRGSAVRPRRLHALRRARRDVRQRGHPGHGVRRRQRGGTRRGPREHRADPASPATSRPAPVRPGSRSRATPPTVSSTSPSRPRAGRPRRSPRATRSGPTSSRSRAGGWSSAAWRSTSASACRSSRSPAMAPTGP